MNKTIYILWFQGFDTAPDVVKKCVASWKHYNRDWKIILLDNKNLHKYVRIENYINIKNKNINYTALSDIVRIILLKTLGGLWVDSTTFCNKPLNDWLPQYIQEGFFAFDKPGPDRLLSTWFIYSDKDNYIINKWLQSVQQYYTIHNTPHTYYWVHHLFGNLYNSDNIFRAHWDNVPKLSANYLGPHYLLNRMFQRINSDIKNKIDNKSIPLYKLTYKRKFPRLDVSLNVYYLYSTINLTPSAQNDKKKDIDTNKASLSKLFK